MIKLILLIRDFLIVCFGANGSVSFASLYLCDYIKSQYPALTTQETLVIAAYWIRLKVGMHQLNPDTEFDEVVSKLLATRR